MIIIAKMRYLIFNFYYTRNLLFSRFFYIFYFYFKSIRALEVFQMNGERLSEIIEEQRKRPGTYLSINHCRLQDARYHCNEWNEITKRINYLQLGGCNLGGPLRYPHVLIFWLRCEQVGHASSFIMYLFYTWLILA